MSDKYPTVYLQGGDTQAEFVIANPELPGGAYVPVSELRELIEQWRDDAPVQKVLSGMGKGDEAWGKLQCAKQLEELLE